MQDKYEQVFADLQTRYLQEVEGMEKKGVGEGEGKIRWEGMKSRWQKASTRLKSPFFPLLFYAILLERKEEMQGRWTMQKKAT